MEYSKSNLLYPLISCRITHLKVDPVSMSTADMKIGNHSKLSDKICWWYF